jgi:hypothetical protein
MTAKAITNGKSKGLIKRGKQWAYPEKENYFVMHFLLF